MELNEIIVRIKQRDENALAELIQLYSKLLWTVAGGILSCSPYCTREDAEECVGDIFLSVWQNPEKYDQDRGSLKSYLCMLTKSRALNIYRKKSRDDVVYLDDFTETAGEDFEELTDYSELHEAISKLPEPTRTILIRRYFYEKKPRQIAEEMNLPSKEVENRLYRGKQFIAAQLKESRAEEPMELLAGQEAT